MFAEIALCCVFNVGNLHSNIVCMIVLCMHGVIACIDIINDINEEPGKTGSN